MLCSEKDDLMKYQITILLIVIQILNSFGQNRSETRAYVFIDHSYEKITLKKDSFNYIFSVGLSGAHVDGTIKYRNDTLIFNSELILVDFTIKNRKRRKKSSKELKIYKPVKKE